MGSCRGSRVFRAYVVFAQGQKTGIVLAKYLSSVAHFSIIMSARPSSQGKHSAAHRRPLARLFFSGNVAHAKMVPLQCLSLTCGSSSLQSASS